jgi:class 3 adenylate cyclase
MVLTARRDRGRAVGSVRMSSSGDTILLTQHCVDALTSRPDGLADRGAQELKGKSATVQVFALYPASVAST